VGHYHGLQGIETEGHTGLGQDAVGLTSILDRRQLSVVIRAPILCIVNSLAFAKQFGLSSDRFYQLDYCNALLSDDTDRSACCNSSQQLAASGGHEVPYCVMVVFAVTRRSNKYLQWITQNNSGSRATSGVVLQVERSFIPLSRAVIIV